MAPSLIINLDKYYGLVRYRAKKVHNLLLQAGKKEIELKELIQEGFVGLAEARNSYDPKKGVAFATFALYRIDGAIRDYLRSLDPLTQRERQKVKELDRAREELIRSLGRQPCIRELAQALAISEGDVKKREALRVVILSLEKLIQSAEESEKQKLWEIPSGSPDPEEELIINFTEKERTRLATDVNNCLEKALHNEERTVLTQRVLGDIPLQLLGRFLNISKDTVRRRELEARRKMRQCLESKGWEVSDIIELLP